MKFLRFEYDNKIKNGYYDGEKVVELKKDILTYFKKNLEDITKDFQKSYSIDEINIIKPVEPSKIICIDLNYKDHAEEMNLELPESPVIFIKPSNTVIGYGDKIIYPDNSTRVDYEGELAVVIGEKTSKVTKEEAKEKIFGYTIMNDVTARDFTYSDGQWTRGKSCDTFAPLGPVIETEMNPMNQNIKLTINDEIKQDSNTKNMIFSPYDLIEYISQNITLYPGDIISTGTPPGVGPMEKESNIKISIDDIGTLINKLI